MIEVRAHRRKAAIWMLMSLPTRTGLRSDPGGVRTEHAPAGPEAAAATSRCSSARA